LVSRGQRKLRFLLASGGQQQLRFSLDLLTRGHPLGLRRLEETQFPFEAILLVSGGQKKLRFLLDSGGQQQLRFSLDLLTQGHPLGIRSEKTQIPYGLRRSAATPIQSGCSHARAKLTFGTKFGKQLLRTFFVSLYFVNLYSS
jgi:hypothetical protein